MLRNRMREVDEENRRLKEDINVIQIQLSTLQNLLYEAKKERDQEKEKHISSKDALMNELEIVTNKYR